MVPAALTDTDRSALRRALELAEQGRGRVSPNPMVGAVLARDGATIGEGFHARVGDLHAERAALADCASRGNDPAGATMYVTLEPCGHEGRQPPCAPAIAEAGIGRVVYATEDPSAKTAGVGPRLLRERGVEVVVAEGTEAEEARRLNPAFRKHSITGKPLVTYKCAASIDGRTVTAAGQSKWISGEESRLLVHRWRAQSDAVAVGIGTAIADDPQLTARGVGAERQPARVVFDSGARLPLDSALVASADETPVYLIASEASDASAVEALRERGVEVLLLGGDGSARIPAGLLALGERDVTSVLLEGGAGLAGAFLDAGEIDEMRLFLAPVLIGGEGAGNIFDGVGAKSVEQATRPLSVRSESVGADLLVSAAIKDW
jgi:diaminohydroxyphosphoribosylaminopyrimidine deaminase/5-amino-6-(5-phosphoribosylamino)uracil reductase